MRPPRSTQSTYRSQQKQQVSGKVYALFRADVGDKGNVVEDCEVRIGGNEMLVDLIVLDMFDFNVIMGMDWLANYHANMDCFAKTIDFRISEVDSGLMFEGVRNRNSTPLISAFKAERLIRCGCEGYIAFISDIKPSQKLEDIHGVCEFPNVFPEEIPGLPPVREVEFTIELMPGTAPISKAPYRMALAKRRELKEQL
ncbi:hypothetical protein AAC387_Pa07g1889 [Persea americana]